ncbi:uncharacterized protein LOC119026796 isoform X1 [Acanthopagrus latus]|uniref:uncharacterized protein LOC119026796 isoform X1 n=1 Tax=Acanthopagrus latus TaxID=8177 RepID=UPI00187CDCFA|nr:uncharacterized protein LOC119026796 isoform X1 [Acanthopagrus latus]
MPVTSVQDCVSTFAPVEPLDIFKQTSGQFPVSPVPGSIPLNLLHVEPSTRAPRPQFLFPMSRGNVFSLLHVVGGLLMAVTAGGRCVDVALRTAQDPANLLRLSNTLMGLMGRRYRTHDVNSAAKRKVKRLYFTDSFNSLLDIASSALQGTCDLQVLCWLSAFPEKQTDLEPTPANCISARRCRIHYILIRSVSRRPILTLCIGDGGSELNAHNPANQLLWLIIFSSEAQARGDLMFLFLSGQTERISAGSATNKPTSLTLGLSALAVVLFWMLLSHISVCAAICLGWMAQRQIQRLLQSQKRSS